MIYLLAQKWRGSIHVSNLRYFGGYDALKAHVSKKKPSYWSGGEPWHVYEVFSDGREARPLTPNENRTLGLRPPREK